MNAYLDPDRLKPRVFGTGLGRAGNPVRTLTKEIGWLAAPFYMRRHYRPPPQILARMDEHRAIFVHIPKTGGTSICEALYGAQTGHRDWRHWQRTLPDRFEAYATFAIIREPVERFLSSYDYLLTGPGPAAREYCRRHSAAMADINKFVGAILRRPAMLSIYFLHPQHAYVLDRRRLAVTRLFRFETMSDGVKAMFGVAPPHANRTGGPRTRRSDLSEVSLAALEAIYAEDARLYDTCR